MGKLIAKPLTMFPLEVLQLETESRPGKWVKLPLIFTLDLPEQQLLPRVPGSHQDAGPGIFSFSNLGAEIGNTSNAHFAEISLIQYSQRFGSSKVMP